MEKKYTGVTWNRAIQKWVSKVGYNGVTYECGYYDTPEAGAKARDLCIIKNGLGKELQILKPAKK